MLCEYKDIFGKVGEGIHSYRFLNIAIIDVIATVIIAYVVHKIFNINFLISLGILFLVGIISHRLFCVHTTIDKLIDSYIK